MQMHPSDHRGYKEQQYYSVVEEDYVYKDEYSYNNGSIMQMMKPDHCLPKHTYNHNHAHASYGGGYTDHEKKDHDGHMAHYYDKERRPHASYGGGYTDHEKKGHDGHMAHYYEQERRRDGWGDHSAHAGHRHQHQHHNGEGIQHAGYGAHQAQGHYRPHPDHRKKVSAWEFKSIVD